MGKMRRTFLGAVILGALLSLLGMPVFEAHRFSVRSRILYRAPSLEPSAFSDRDLLLVEVWVDPRGKVEDYRVLTDAGSKDLTPQMKNTLIFATFRPATLMGKPVAGPVLLALSKTAGVGPTATGN